MSSEAHQVHQRTSDQKLDMSLEHNSAAVEGRQTPGAGFNGSPSSGLPSLYSPVPHPSTGRYLPHLNGSSPSSTRLHSGAPSHPMSRTHSLIEESQFPPCLLSPPFTPPTSTPGTPSLLGVSTVGQVHSNPNLMNELPDVNCIVRARIPT